MNVTIKDVCAQLLPEIVRGLAEHGIAKAPQCPSRSGVILHQPEKNTFFLRDRVKLKVDGVEKIVPFSASATYRVDDSGLPAWTAVTFSCDDSH